MTSDLQIDIAIDKTHLKDTKKIYPHLRNKYPDVSEKRVAAVNKTRPKDAHPHSKKNYYVPIFASHRGCYQMDLIEQSRNRPEGYPAYYLTLINVNTKYGYAFPIDNKDQETIRDKLEEFIQSRPPDSRVFSLVADQESAFRGNLVADLLEEHNIGLKMITDQRHTALAAVDRFIRMLRDMNTPTVHGKHQSDDPKYRDFSVNRMNKLLDIYNKTIHDSTGYTPEQMEQDKKLEEVFIIKKLYELERRKKITDFDLSEGTYVRYILPKDPMKKHRYKVSPEAYKISHKEGNAYVLQAQDGTTKTVARWRLFPVGKTLPPKLKFAKTFGNNMGVVSRIIAYWTGLHSYEVVFVDGDGNETQGLVHERALRGDRPHQRSPLEEAFWGTIEEERRRNR